MVLMFAEWRWHLKVTGVGEGKYECKHVSGSEFKDVGLSQVIFRKKVCAEEQLDRFLDDIRGNAGVHVLRSRLPDRIP